MVTIAGMVADEFRAFGITEIGSLSTREMFAPGPSLAGVGNGSRPRSTHPQGQHVP